MGRSADGDPRSDHEQADAHDDPRNDDIGESFNYRVIPYRVIRISAAGEIYAVLWAALSVRRCTYKRNG
ncbi:hypothetical protein D3C84_1206090 [compost metagenome]